MLLRLGCAYAAALVLGPAWTALAFAALLLQVRRGRLRFDLGLLPALALAAALGTLDRAARVPSPPEAGCRVNVRAWVCSAPERSGRGWRSLARVEEMSGSPPGLDRAAWRGARLRCRSRQPLPAYGGRFEAHGFLRPARPPRNFGAFDEGSDLAAAGAAAVLEIETARSVPGGRGPAWRRQVIEPLRAKLTAALSDCLAPSQAGLLAALVVGARDGVDARTSEAWRALGISHILSISGMHVGLVAAGLLALAGTPRRGRGLLVLLAGLWVYAALGGLGPTVLRSCWMATWGAMALYVGRTRQPLLALGLASLLLVWGAPERRYDLGLQLSCLSTAGLLVWARPLSRLGERLTARGRPGRAAAWALVSAGIGLGAQAATLPLVLWRFGFVSLWAPVANLVCVPLTDAALVLGLLGAPLVLLWEGAGRPFWLLSGALLYVADVATRAATAACEARLFVQPDAWALGAAILVATSTLGAGMAAGAGRRRATLGLLGATFLGLASIAWQALHPEREAWRFEALDVGQGDALVLSLGPNVWLVDAGDAAPVDRGQQVVVPHLRRMAVRRLRGFVLSHPHLDHCGGARAVLRALPVDTLYLAGASRRDSLYLELRATFPSVPVRSLQAGERLVLGPGYEARVLWPESTDVLHSGGNGCSVCLWARGAGHPDLLLMGDLEANGEARLLERSGDVLRAAAPDLAILKAAHHGSCTSSTPGFLEAAGAEVAVVSVGVANRYGHPCARTLRALGAHDCAVLRTDRGGAVRLLERGAALWLERPGQRAVLLASPESARR